MRLIALNGFAGSGAPWRGALVVRGQTGGAGVLLDPTAALATRLEVEPALRRRAGLDGNARAVVLTAAPLEQVAALIAMRHGAPIDLYASPAVFESLTQALPVLPRLQPHCAVHWRMVPVAGDRLTASFAIRGGAGLRGTAAASAEDARLAERAFFGDFTLHGDAWLHEVAAAYGLPLPLEATGQTLAGFLNQAFHGRPVVGDRTRLDGMELVVREIVDGRITRVGIKLTPLPPPGGGSGTS